MILYFRVKFFEWREQRRVERLYYSNECFRNSDQALLSAYAGISPYQISKEFLIKLQAPEIFAYGETPLTTTSKIVSECAITSADVVIEMGAGRGRASLFLAEYVGCRVIAYEQIPAFIQKIPPSSNLKTLTQDMFSADFSEATVIYLYGTLLTDSEIQKLTLAFPKNVKIITVSYPLSDYSQKYVTRKSFRGKFPWGKTEIYWNERIS